MSNKPRMFHRRLFCKSALMITGALTLAPLIRKTGAGQTPPPAVAQTPKKGYRLTSHIRKYYDTAAGIRSET